MDTALLVVDSLQDLVASVEGDLEAAPVIKRAPSPEEMRDKLRTWEAKFVRAQAKATVKAVRADWQVFHGWCERAGACPLPVATEQLLRFLTDMVVAGRKRATLNRYVYTVREIHKAAGAPDPTLHESWALDWKDLVNRLTEANRNAPRQAQPLKQRHVAAILDHLGDTPRDLRNAALIALASDTLCRESELAAVTLEMLEQSDDGPWTLALGKIKNDPEGLGSYRFVSDDTKARIDRWCAAADITAGYLFLPLGGRPKAPVAKDAKPPPPHLRPPEVARILRTSAAAAGIKNARRVSGHSTRVGSTIDLLEAGFSTRDTQYAGGWKTERMVMQYGKQARAGRNAMAQLRSRQAPTEPES